jgi:CBS domain-containing protein
MNFEKIAMRNVVSIEPKASVHDAARKMREHGVKRLPLVNEAGGLS